MRKPRPVGTSPYTSVPPLPPARERIKAAASRLYSTYGIQLPLATIANAAQTNVEMIHKYFGSEERLIIDFLNHCEEAIEAEWEEPEEEFPDDHIGQIRCWLEGKQVIAEDGDWSCFDLLRAAAMLLPNRRSAVLAYIRQVKLKERDKLAAKCKAADFRDPRALADKLMLLIEGGMAGNLIYGLNGPAVELLKAAELMMASHKAP